MHKQRQAQIRHDTEQLVHKYDTLAAQEAARVSDLQQVLAQLQSSESSVRSPASTPTKETTATTTTRRSSQSRSAKRRRRRRQRRRESQSLTLQSLVPAAAALVSPLRGEAFAVQATVEETSASVSCLGAELSALVEMAGFSDGQKETETMRTIVQYEGLVLNFLLEHLSFQGSRFTSELEPQTPVQCSPAMLELRHLIDAQMLANKGSVLGELVGVLRYSSSDTCKDMALRFLFLFLQCTHHLALGQDASSGVTGSWCVARARAPGQCHADYISELRCDLSCSACDKTRRRFAECVSHCCHGRLFTRYVKNSLLLLMVIKPSELYTYESPCERVEVFGHIVHCWQVWAALLQSSRQASAAVLEELWIDLVSLCARKGENTGGLLHQSDWRAWFLPHLDVSHSLPGATVGAVGLEGPLTPSKDVTDPHAAVPLLRPQETDPDGNDVASRTFSAVAQVLNIMLSELLLSGSSIFVAELQQTVCALQELWQNTPAAIYLVRLLFFSIMKRVQSRKKYMPSDYTQPPWQCWNDLSTIVCHFCTLVPRFGSSAVLGDDSNKMWLKASASRTDLLAFRRRICHTPSMEIDPTTALVGPAIISASAVERWPGPKLSDARVLEQLVVAWNALFNHDMHDPGADELAMSMEYADLLHDFVSTSAEHCRLFSMSERHILFTAFLTANMAGRQRLISRMGRRAVALPTVSAQAEATVERMLEDPFFTALREGCSGRFDKPVLNSFLRDEHKPDRLVSASLRKVMRRSFSSKHFLVSAGADDGDDEDNSEEEQVPRAFPGSLRSSRSRFSRLRLEISGPPETVHEQSGSGWAPPLSPNSPGDILSVEEEDQDWSQSEIDTPLPREPSDSALNSFAHAAGKYKVRCFGRKKKASKSKTALVEVTADGLTVSYRKGPWFSRKDLVEKFSWSDSAVRSSLRLDDSTKGELSMSFAAPAPITLVFSKCDIEALQAFVASCVHEHS